MMRRRLSCLLVLYVTLDFANPLMPGAVGFSGGSVRVVPADRTPRAGAASLPVPAVLPTPSPASIDEDRERRAVAWLAPPPPRRDGRRLTPARRLDVPPSPIEDH